MVTAAEGDRWFGAVHFRFEREIDQEQFMSIHGKCLDTAKVAAGGVIEHQKGWDRSGLTPLDTASEIPKFEGSA